MDVPGDDVVIRSLEGPLEGARSEDPRCLNCDAPLSGPYCALCGQKAGDLHVSLGEFVREALDSLFSFDSRFWRTLRPLLIRPGWLTLEYWHGRRARFLPPLRLYLFISFVFFLLSGLLGGSRVIDTSGDPNSESMVRFSFTGAQGESQEVNDRSDVDWDADFADAPGYFRWLARNVLRPAVEEPERTRAAFERRLPWATFFLVPVFAVWLRVLFRERERFFVPHLVFALHFQAAGFVFLLLGDVIDRVTGTEIGSGVSAVVLVTYLFLAFRRVYRNGRMATGLKELGLLIVHGLALLVTMVLLLGLTTLSL